MEKHGKTGTKDISIGEVRENRWGHKKLSSAALDYLYNTGVLTVTYKRGTQKYFDLTERVLDSENLSCDPNMTVEEFLEWYVERRIQSVGFLWNKFIFQFLSDCATIVINYRKETYYPCKSSDCYLCGCFSS